MAFKRKILYQYKLTGSHMNTVKEFQDQEDFDKWYDEMSIEYKIIGVHDYKN